MCFFQVLFAICHDQGPLSEIEKESGKAVSVSTTAAGAVTWEVVDESQLTASDTSDSKPQRKLSISIPKWCGKWVVGMDDYKDGVVGAKSKNLAGKPSYKRAVPICCHPSESDRSVARTKVLSTFLRSAHCNSCGHHTAMMAASEQIWSDKKLHD